MLSQVERVRIVWDLEKLPSLSRRKEPESKRTDQICALLVQCKNLRIFMIHIPASIFHAREILEVVQILASVRFERLEIACLDAEKRYLSTYSQP